MSYVPRDYIDLLLASVLVLVNGALSVALRLRLEWPLAVAAVRMTVQLLLVGLVLTALFSVASPWLTLGVALFMIGFAGREAHARQAHRFSGWWSQGLGTGTLMVAAMLVTVLALTTAVRPDPWYDPRFAIPLLGMVLGNAMNGVSLGLDTLTSRAREQRAAVEARLALGAHRFEALSVITRPALRAGMMPIINSMSATGLVALPGMMTGQILAGVEPEQAVKYQVLVMFLIAGATGIGSLAAVMGGAWRLTDSRHRLRLDRLRQPRG